MLLAIDTATRTAGLALYNDQGVQAEVTWRSRENHTVELMAQLVRLLSLAHVAKSDLRAIGVALGPGSFTGLRVGMSVAKGLAFGSRLPLLGIPTLDAVALPHAFQSVPIWAVISAGRGRYSVACYTAQLGVIRRTSNYALVNPPGLVDLVLGVGGQDHDYRAAPAFFVGEIDAPLAGLLAERLGERAILARPSMNMRRAGFLAELAWARWMRGEADDTAALAPMYIPHESVEGSPGARK